MRAYRLWAGMLALVLIGAVAAGCGGDDGGEPTAATPPVEEASALSKEELLAQGDAICAEVNAAVGTVDSVAEGEQAAEQAAALYGGMVERLKSLGPPSDDSAGYEEFITAAEQLSQAQDDVRLAAERGESEALAEAEAEASAALDSFQSAADSYGFQQCGEAPAAPQTGGASPSPAGEEGEGEGEAAGGAEAAPEEAEVAPETGGAGAAEEEAGGETGGGAAPGGGETGGGGSSGGIGPG